MKRSVIEFERLTNMLGVYVVHALALQKPSYYSTSRTTSYFNKVIRWHLRFFNKMQTVLLCEPSQNGMKFC